MGTSLAILPRLQSAPGWTGRVVTIRAYPYIEVVRTTKRAILVRVPNKPHPVRVPRKDTEFKTSVTGKRVMLVEDHIADFIGLVDEVTL